MQIYIETGKITPYELTAIVANAISKNILHRKFHEKNSRLEHSMNIFEKPIEQVKDDIFPQLSKIEPFYSITVPAVIQIAYLRSKNQL